MGNSVVTGKPSASVQVRIKREQLDKIINHFKNPNYRGRIASERVKKMTRNAQIMEEFINDYFELHKKYKKVNKEKRINQLQLTQNKLDKKIKEVETLQGELITMVEDLKKMHQKFKQNK